VLEGGGGGDRGLSAIERGWDGGTPHQQFDCPKNLAGFVSDCGEVVCGRFEVWTVLFMDGEVGWAPLVLEMMMAAKGLRSDAEAAAAL